MGQLTIRTNGQTLLFTGATNPAGATVGVWSDAGLSSAVSLPVTVSADTTYYLRDGDTTVTVTQPDGSVVYSGQVSVGTWPREIIPQPTDPQAWADLAGLSGTYAPRIKTLTRGMPEPWEVLRTAASAPTIGAVTTTTAIVTGIDWLQVALQDGGVNQADVFTYLGASQPVAVSNVFPNYTYVKFASMTHTTTTQFPRVAFMFDGTTLELFAKQVSATGAYRLWVDGEIAQDWTGVTMSGNTNYLPITFGSRKLRRIEVELNNLYWGGVRTGINDTIVKAQRRGPRVVVVGDSFTEGTGATYGMTGWPRTFGAHLAWDDLFVSGVGQTGYLNPGSGGRVKFGDRLTNDVINQAPDVVVWAGGLNDSGTYSDAAVQAEATADFTIVRNALPSVVQIVLSPFWPKGAEGFSTTILGTRSALRSAAAAVPGCVFVDLLEMPLDVTPISTTLAATTSLGATLSLSAAVPKGSTIRVGTGDSAPRYFVSNISGAAPHTVTVQGTNVVAAGIASGTPVTVVGASYMTGTGRVGATTGVGNADLYTGSDTTHPTQAGHDYIGRVAALLTRRALLLAS